MPAMKKQIPELDGLRGIGILALLVAHFLINSFNFVWIFIDCFFVLSGFLISRILINEKHKAGSWWQKFKTYWVRRVLRIFPAYYLYLFILAVLFFLFSYPADLPQQIAYLLTYTYNFASTDILHSQTYQVGVHLWSLCVEEQFYLFLPLIIFALSRKGLQIAALLFILFSIGFRFFYGQHLIDSGLEAFDAGDGVYRHTFSHLDAFFCGIAINIFNTTEWKHRKNMLAAYTVLLVLAGVANYLSVAEAKNVSDYLYSLGFFFAGIKNYQYVWSYTMMAVFFMLLMNVLIADSGDENSVLHKVFRWRVLRELGRVSYGIYLYHWAVLVVLDKFVFVNKIFDPLWPERNYWFPLYALIVYLISLLSYYGFERLFLNNKPAYTEPAPAKAAEVIPPVKKGGKRNKV